MAGSTSSRTETVVRCSHETSVSLSGSDQPSSGTTQWGRSPRWITGRCWHRRSRTAGASSARVGTRHVRRQDECSAWRATGWSGRGRLRRRGHRAPRPRCRPSWSAFDRADSSTSSPREVLTTTAVGFIRASARPSIQVPGGDRRERHVHRHEHPPRARRSSSDANVTSRSRSRSGASRNRVVVDQGRSPPAELLRDLLADAPHSHDPDRRAPQLVEPLRARCSTGPARTPASRSVRCRSVAIMSMNGVLGDRDRVGARR